MDWNPLGNNVVVKKVEMEEEVTTSGLFVVTTEKNDIHKRAEVVAVGPGINAPLTVSEGDTVLYNGLYGTDIGSFHTAVSNEYMILSEDDIIAIITE